jgi:hypothetical protein
MATKTKPKTTKTNKSKLRGGTSDNPADEPLIPVPEASAEQPSVADWMAAAPEGQEQPETREEPTPEPSGDDAAAPFPLDESNCYDSPEALAAWDADTAREAELRRRKRAELWLTEDSSKAAHKADKAAAEEYEKDFFEWLRERDEQRGKPPQPKQGSIPFPEPDGQVDRPDLPLAPAAGDEAWKSIPLTVLADKDGFPEYLIEKLANAARKDDRPQAPITTLGELTAFQEPEPSGYQKKLTDLVGVGPGAAEKIGEACIRFWGRWAKEEAGRRASVQAEASEEAEESTEEGSDE